MAFAVLAALAARAIVRGLRGDAEHDLAHRFLAVAVRGLPPGRLPWGRAMLAELDQLEGRQTRLRFASGCALAAGRIRLRSPQPGGAGLRAVILGCAAFSLALVGYGFVQYPGLRSEPDIWWAMIGFLVTLLVYAGLAIVLARGVSPQAIAARRLGLGGGLATGACWMIGIVPPAALKGWVFLPLLLALMGPATVAMCAGRRFRDSRTADLTALWSGLVAGLTVFAVWVTLTYANAGGPYDDGLVRDFHTSGAHDLATYAVSDSLGSGLVLLAVIPTVALALGTLGTRLFKASRQT
ncbi:MAG TPA: hypothetical protein VLK36_17285 [Gaiellaceae bacterium]|nr:hypothetical protein [Gaiellaceae bacterium]